MMQTYTKESLKRALLDIRELGWIPNQRPGNDGGVGNTLEDLLGIEEKQPAFAERRRMGAQVPEGEYFLSTNAVSHGAITSRNEDSSADSPAEVRVATRSGGE